MKIINRYIISEVMKVGIIVTFLASFLLLGIDLFRNLDSYITYNVPASTVLRLTMLFFPESVLFAVGPAFLFSVTYFLSMMSSNNETIAILNSTVSYSKIIRVILICGIFSSAFYFFFNEKVTLPSSMKKQTLYEASVNTSYDSEDNYRIALSDMTQSYMVYAGQYLASSERLNNLNFIKVLPDETIIRINAASAQWDRESKHWIFIDSTTYTYYPDGRETEIKYESMAENQYLLLEPEMFRNLSDEISSMPLETAKNYIQQMKKLDVDQYYEMATSYYSRILNCLSPLILVIIGCSMNYRFKKNILFLSIIVSICVAVVYYVVRIITVMLAQQGVIAPYLGTVVPFVVVILISVLVSLFVRRFS